MVAVWKKELRQYMVSVIGAVFLASYGGLIGYYFVMGNLMAMNGNIAVLFGSVYSTLMVLIPILTMRLFAEERKMRTDQLLFTSPISTYKIILGKFFAAYQIFVIGSIPVLIAAFILAYYGSFQPLELTGCLVGLCLAGGAFLSIGLFASAITESQVVAAIVSYLLMIFFWLIDYMKYYVHNFWMAKFLEYLSFQSHFRELSSGIFKFSTMSYFASVTVLMLGLTYIILESRRWK